MSGSTSKRKPLVSADITDAVITPATGPVNFGAVLQVASVLNTDETATHHYFGADPASGWIVNRYDASGIRTKATIANNSGTTDYATAWANHLTLNYA